MKKQSLLILSELFPPEETSTAYIMGEIANELVKKYHVTVICGPAVYDQNKKQDANSLFQLDPSICLIRVKGYSEDKVSVISRANKFIQVSWQIYKETRKCIDQFDHVFMVSNPFPLILLMGHLRRKRNFKLTMLVHDIFPESLYTELSLPGFVYKMAGRMFNKAYASVDTLISLGRDMTDILSKKIGSYKHTSQIIQIENWGDIQHIHPKENTETGNQVVIQYAGNIGRAQGVSDFVRLIENVNNPCVKFSIWGTGSESNDIKSYIADKKLVNISLNGPYFRSQQEEVLNQCDMALITLVDGMYGLGVPSKSYNIMAAGKAILFIGDLKSEIALTVKENRIGFCFESADKEGLQSFLAGLDNLKKMELVEMGKRSRHLAETKYSKEVILRKFSECV